ncbi:MAG: hypothetical protein JWL77_3201 [Chthonomonadaceae bacterium]|nr:hypothetical protein [Chthonomonadaceae bacterium]
MIISAPHRLGMACLPLTAALLTAASAPSAHAQISFVNMFRNVSATQTGNGNTLASTGAFFSTSLTSVNPGDFSAVTMTYPGPGSPTSLPQTSATSFTLQTGQFPTQAAMDTAFPTGTYTYNTTGGTQGTATTNFSYAADHYASAQPFLTGTDYSALQGANAATPLTVHFSPFATDPSVTSQFEFFTIFDTSLNTFVYDAGFLPHTTSSVTVAAGTLQPGHNYIYELDDSNRLNVSSPGANFPAQIGYDLRTNGTFTTAPAATPEPGTLALLLTGGIGGSLILRRRRR